MTYLRPHNIPGQRARRITSTVMAVLAVIVGLIQWLAPSAIPGLFMSVAHPFWQTEFAVSSGSLKSAEQLLSENEALKRQLAEMKAEVASSSVGLIIQENNEFRAQLGRATSTPKLLAAVLSRPPMAPYDEIIIDVGKDRGVGTTTLVYAANNVLIGRVREVYAHMAKVVLFTSPGQSYSVTIGSAHIPATAAGQGGGQYRAEVAHGAAVQVGDSVSDSFLKDGVIGSVKYVITDPANPFDSLYIAPAFNLYELRWVYLNVRF